MAPKPLFKDSLTTSLKIWERDSEILKDILILCEKYGVDYSVNDYFGEKSSMLTFDETYDLWDLSETKLKYIKQVHQANIIANIIVLLCDEIMTKEGIDVMASLSAFTIDEIIIE